MMAKTAAVFYVLWGILHLKVAAGGPVLWLLAVIFSTLAIRQAPKPA